MQGSHSQTQPVPKFPTSSSTVVSTTLAPSVQSQSRTTVGSELSPLPPPFIPSTATTTLLRLLHQSETGTTSGREHSHTPSPSLLLSPPLAQDHPSPSTNHSNHNYTNSHTNRDTKSIDTKTAGILTPPLRASGSEGGSLPLPGRRGLTKEEEEERAAKMSHIWGDGRLSDDTEAHLEWERRGRGGVGWGGCEGVWDDKTGGSLSTQQHTPKLSWDQVPLVDTSDTSDTVWSSLDPVGAGEGDHSIQDRLVAQAHPLPCEFGPIGKVTKKTTTASTMDDSGTTVETKVDNKSTDTGSVKDIHASSGNPESLSQNCPSVTNSKQSGEGVLSPPKNRSASSELWVSEEMENWTHEGPLDAMLFEGRGEKKQTRPSTGSLATTPRSPEHSHVETSSVAEGIATSSFEHLGSPEAASDSSFEDMAIIVKQRAVTDLPDSTIVPGPPADAPRDSLWRDALDLEPENQEPLFPKPSPETSPESKQHGSARPLPPSPCVASVALPPPSTGTYHDSSSAPTVPSLSGDIGAANPESAECSTPTLIPPGDDEDDSGGGGLVMAVFGGRDKGCKDYFPSAFGPEMQAVDAEYSEVSGEVPSNDVTITSSVVDSHSDSQVTPVNCVSMPPATWPSLLPAEEAAEVTREETLPLEVSVSNVQESSTEPGIYQPCLLSPAGADAPPGKKEEGGGVTNEVSDPQSDLVFLVECFPDLGRSFLSLLLQQNQGNVEEAVSSALLSTITSHLPLSIGGGESEVFGHGFPPSLGYHQLCIHDKTRLSVQEPSSSAASVTSESEMESGVNGDLVVSEDDACADDEEIARIIHEQLNFENLGESDVCAVRMSERAEGEVKGEEGEGKGEEGAPVSEVQEDDNLVLRLSRSLASQLQQMFGSVANHLPQEGASFTNPLSPSLSLPPSLPLYLFAPFFNPLLSSSHFSGVLRDEDLQVLLSERAAQQIWQKWIDTLQVHVQQSVVGSSST